MLSFNHYAYGAVVDWVYRTLAGLAPDPDAPGYRHVVLAPRPVAGIDRVSRVGPQRLRTRVGATGAPTRTAPSPAGTSCPSA